MKMNYLCPRWGSEALSPSAFIHQVRTAGYDGIELGVTDPDPMIDEIVQRAQGEGLTVVTQHHDTFERDVPRHLEKYEARLRAAMAYAPLFVNSHTGRDCFSLEENLQVFEVAHRVEQETGVPVYHETHRGRCGHTPWRTVELLKAMPTLKLVLDLSHWCNVCESLLADQEDELEQVIPHVAYIHARVGWAHGPQVSDPQAPEWKAEVDVHLKWWDKIVALQRAAGTAVFNIAPEFGPPPYLPLRPYTMVPVANQWDINVYMMTLLRDRYR